MAGTSSLAGLAGMASPIGAAASIAPMVFKLFKSIQQGSQAKAIRPVDPGFQVNSGVMDNQRIVNSMYNNYELPGMAGIENNLNRSFASGMAGVQQGATSSGDVMDTIAKLSAGQNDSINALGIQAAQGKENMLGQVLQANEAAGAEGVRRNAFDLDRYEKKLAEKAALQEASIVNGFSAADGIGTAAGSFLNYQTPSFTPTVGNVKLGASAFAKAAKASMPKKFGDI